MAVIWKKNIDNVNYEIRTAGSSTRLYTDGVFHSQYNARSGLSGGVWDLLMLPVFFNPESVKRVLVLGVGGGAVIKQLLNYATPDLIVGVEINATHLYLGKKYFGLTDSRVELIHADAIDWLSQYSGPKFDLIVDDLFGESKGEPVRAIDVNNQWIAKIYAHLNKTGIVVANFICRKQLSSSGFIQSRSKGIQSAFGLSLAQYENEIGVFLRFKSSPLQLRNNLAKVLARGHTGRPQKIDYRIRTIRF